MDTERGGFFKALVMLIGVITVAIIIVMVVLFAGFSHLIKSTTMVADDALVQGRSAPIAVIDIKGLIMDSRDTIKLLLKAEIDPEISAIIVRIDSPGGAVAPVQEIYEEIRRIDKLRPVYASLGSMAASGGYYIASAARKIFASSGTLVGSIGVIMNFADLSKLYEWAKVRPSVIKAGKYKDIGNPSRPMSEEEIKLLKNLMDSVHAQFKQHIVDGRGKKIKGSIDQYAEGQIFSGSEAKEYGLVDEIAGLYEAGRKIHKELNISSKFDIKFYKKNSPFSLVEFLGDVEETVSNIKQVFSAKSSSILAVPY